MAISFVSTATGTTTWTMPTHAKGDLILVWAFNSSVNTFPTVPTGYANVGLLTGTFNGTSSSGRLCYRYAQSSSEVSGTWTNATNTAVAVYRGVTSVGLAVVQKASSGTTMTYPALTMETLASTSWVVRIAGNRSATNMNTNTPASYTSRTSSTSKTRIIDRSGISSNPTADTQATSPTGEWVCASVELRSDVAGPAITDLFNDVTSAPNATNWTVTGATVDTVNHKLLVQTSQNVVSNFKFDFTGQSVTLGKLSSTGSGGVFISFGSSVTTATSGTGLSPVDGLAFDWNSNAYAKYVGNVTTTVASLPSLLGVYIRMRESGGTMYWDTSTDNVNWTNQASSALPAGAPITCCTIKIHGNLSGTTGVEDFNPPPPVTGTMASSMQRARFAGYGPMPATATFFDDFANLSQFSAVFTAETATVSGGAVHIPVENAGFGQSAIYSLNNYDLAGSSLTFKVTSLPASAGVGGGNSVTFGIVDPDGVFICPAIGAFDGNLVVGGASVAWNPAVNPYVRLRETGGTAYYEYGPDNANWTAIGSEPVSGLDRTWGAISALTNNFSGVTDSGELVIDTINPVAGATGGITSTFQRALSILSGGHEQTGTISSTMLKQLSALAGAQAQSGSVASRFQLMLAALAGLQTQTGTITSTMKSALLTSPQTKPEFASVGSNLAYGLRTNSSIPVPPGVVARTSDIVVVVLYVRSNGTPVTAVPLDFVEAPNSPIVNPTSGDAHVIHVYWRRPDAADAGTYTFTHASQNSSGFALRFTGCAATGNPFDVTSAAASSVAVSTTPAVSVTTTGDTELLLWIGDNEAANTFSTLSGFTERIFSEGISAQTKDQTSAGASGSLTTTFGATAAATAFVGALRPSTNVHAQSGSVAAALRQMISALAGSTPYTGAIQSTMLAATSALTGAQTQTGSAAMAMQQLVAAAAGNQPFTGAIQSALMYSTAALAGAQTQTGAAAMTLQRMLTSAIGEQPYSGSMAATLQYARATLQGAQTQTGVIASALQYATSSLTGSQTQTGTMSAVLQRLSIALVGSMAPSGSLESILRWPEMSASGQQAQTGSAASTMQAPTASASGAMAPSGSIASTLQYAQAALAAAQTQSGTIDSALQYARSAMAGSQTQSATMAAALTQLSMAAAGLQTQTATLASTLQYLVTSAVAEQAQSGTIASTLQRMATVVLGQMEPSGAVSALMQKLSFTGSGDLSSPGAWISTFQRMTAAASGAMLPSGSIDSTLLPATMTAAAQQTLLGALASTMQPMTTTSSGLQIVTGDIATAMIAPTMTATGPAGPSATVSTTMQPALMTAAAEQAYVSSMASALLPATASASGLQIVTGSLAAMMMAPTTALVGTMNPTGLIVSTMVAPNFTGITSTGSEASISSTMQRLVGNLIGTMAPEGGIDSTMTAPTMTASGLHIITGSLASTMLTPTAAALGVMPGSGAIGSTMRAPTFLGLAGSIAAGSISSTLQRTIAAVLASQIIEGSIDSTLSAEQFTGVAPPWPTGSMAATVSRLMMAAAGSLGQSSTIDGALRPVVFAGPGAQVFTGSMAGTVGPLVIVLTGEANVVRGAMSADLTAALMSAAGFTLGFSSTPMPDRIFVVRYEERALAIAFEQRQFDVRGESRIVDIRTEPRTDQIPGESRTQVVQ